MAAGAVGGPSDALHGGRLGGGDHQLVVEGQGAGDAGVDADDHAELEAGFPDAAGLARRRVLAMLPGDAEAGGGALAAGVGAARVGKLRLVHARRGVCGERVGDEVSERSLDDEDLRVGTQQNVHIWAVCLQRRVGAQHRRDDGCWLRAR